MFTLAFSPNNISDHEWNKVLQPSLNMQAFNVSKHHDMLSFDYISITVIRGTAKKTQLDLISV